MRKRIFGSLLTVFMGVSSMAQVSSTLSPYSQFGIGTLADQSQGFNSGMAGLSMGLRDGKVVNVQNPASYSAVDSLTFIMDLGVSGQITNFKEGNKKVNGRTANFDYAVGSFRLMPKVGVCFGIVPYSNIGYDYYRTAPIGTSVYTVTETYYGKGGFSQAFVGAGWEMLKGFSVGVNLSYLWGKYDKNVSLVSSDSYVNTQTMAYSTSVSSYKLDLGLQYRKVLNKYNMLTLGATVGIGHNLKNDATLETTNLNNVTNVAPSNTVTVGNALSLPYSFGFGAMLAHKKSLTAGIDYELQKWGSLDYPMQNEQTGKYESVSGLLKDRHKVTFGVDWLPDPNPVGRKFLKRLHYKFGVSYATPYYKIHGVDGPNELVVSGGLSFPVINTWNNRSVLNISAQWVHMSASNLVTENAFRINIGITFNERWFAKWKVD